jgi:hypothetical protein
LLVCTSRFCSAYNGSKFTVHELPGLRGMYD